MSFQSLIWKNNNMEHIKREQLVCLRHIPNLTMFIGHFQSSITSILICEINHLYD